MKYLIEGWMREKGAIGITYHDCISVDADNFWGAHIAAYESREHFSRDTKITDAHGVTKTFRQIWSEGK